MNTIFDALVFNRIYSQIHKFSLVDRIFRDKALRRANLLKSLEKKFSKNSRFLSDFNALRVLNTLFTSIKNTSQSWESWTAYKKIKSEILNLIINNSTNHLVRMGILSAESLLEEQFYAILINSFEKQPEKIWIERARWFLQNFTMSAHKKNDIDEKIKILINDMKNH